MASIDANKLGDDIVTAIKNEIGQDWKIVADGTIGAVKGIAALANHLSDPANTMTADQKADILADYRDALESAILYHRVVLRVVVKKAVDAAIKVLTVEVPALLGLV